MLTKLLFIIGLIAFLLCGYTSCKKPDWVVSLGYEEKDDYSYYRKCTGALINSPGEKKYKGRLVLTTGKCAQALSAVKNLKAVLKPAGKGSMFKTKKRREKIVMVSPTVPQSGKDIPEFAIAVIDAVIQRPGVSFPKKDMVGITIHAAEWKELDWRCGASCSYKISTKKLGKLESGTDKNIYAENGYVHVRFKGKGTGFSVFSQGSPIYGNNTLVGLLSSTSSNENIYYDLRNDGWRGKIEDLINEVENQLEPMGEQKENEKEENVEKERAKDKGKQLENEGN